jgi:hypothetical protein
MVWIALFIGILISSSTLFYGLRMRDSVVGRILLFFGIGMYLITVSFFSNAILWQSEQLRQFIHDAFFIAGCVTMLGAVHYVRKLRVI